MASLFMKVLFFITFILILSNISGVFRNTMKTFLRKALGCDPIKTPAMVY